jgi:hypothetical protein
MASITSKARNELPDSDFALIEGTGDNKVRKYPIDTKRRAINAKARALQMLKIGRVTRAQYDTIVSRAEAKLKSLKNK